MSALLLIGGDYFWVAQPLLLPQFFIAGLEGFAFACQLPPFAVVVQYEELTIQSASSMVFKIFCRFNRY